MMNSPSRIVMGKRGKRFGSARPGLSAKGDVAMRMR